MPQDNPLIISGTVIPGLGRGRELGFPTANLKLDNPNTRPADGIYACLARLNHTSPDYIALLHTGPRPTFPSAPPTIEVYFIDFPYRELYGEKVQLSNLIHIRGIVKFPSASALIKAVQQDIKQAKTLLTN